MCIRDRAKDLDDAISIERAGEGYLLGVHIADVSHYVQAVSYTHLDVYKRQAQDGDVFETLDGQERQLDSQILMINDGEKAVGIAGIMGGENSKITDDVKTMVFEAACFDGTNIRLSAKRVGLRTDASGKFEKGLDPNTACLLYTSVYGRPFRSRLSFTQSRRNLSSLEEY